MKRIKKAINRLRWTAVTGQRSLFPSTEKKVFVHVGAHKTATSLIQKYTLRNEIDIARQGIFALHRKEMKDLVGWGQHVLRKPQRLRRRVNKAMSKRWVKYVFMSHENTLGKPLYSKQHGLYPFAQQGLEGLRRALDGFDVTLVLSIRPQVDFITSYYLQTIHEGGVQTFEDWTAQFDLEKLYWRPLIECCAKYFGRANVIVVDFQQIREGQQLFIKKFFSNLDRQIQLKPTYETVHNASISRKGLDLALSINPHLTNNRERRFVRKFVQRHFSNLDYERPCFWSSDELDRLTQLYYDDFREAVQETT